MRNNQNQRLVCFSALRGCCGMSGILYASAVLTFMSRCTQRVNVFKSTISPVRSGRLLGNEPRGRSRSDCAPRRMQGTSQRFVVGLVGRYLKSPEKRTRKDDTKKKRQQDERTSALVQLYFFFAMSRRFVRY